MPWTAALKVVEKVPETGQGHLVIVFHHEESDEMVIRDVFIAAPQSDTFLLDLVTPILAQMDALDPYLAQLREQLGPIKPKESE